MYKIKHITFEIPSLISIDFFGILSLHFMPLLVSSLVITLYILNTLKKDINFRNTEVNKRFEVSISIIIICLFLCIISFISIWHTFNVFDKVYENLNNIICNETCIFEKEAQDMIRDTIQNTKGLRPLFVTILILLSLIPMITVFWKNMCVIFVSSGLLYLTAVPFGIFSFLQWMFCGYNEMNMCQYCPQYMTNINEICAIPSYDLFLNILCLFGLSLIQWGKKTTRKEQIDEIELPNNKQFNHRPTSQHVTTTFDKWYSK